MKKFLVFLCAALLLVGAVACKKAEVESTDTVVTDTVATDTATITTETRAEGRRLKAELEAEARPSVSVSSVPLWLFFFTTESKEDTEAQEGK